MRSAGLGLANQQPEGARPRPVRSRDFLGDVAKGGIAGAGVVEPVFRHGHRVSAAVPFTDEARARLQGKTRRGANAACGAQGFRQR